MFGGNFNIASLMKNVKKMQEMMQDAQSELAKIEITGESGAGAVKILMNARHVVKSIHIDDEIMQEDKEILTDLIAAAFNDATSKIDEITKAKMGEASKLFGGMGGDEEK